MFPSSRTVKFLTCSVSIVLLLALGACRDEPAASGRKGQRGGGAAPVLVAKAQPKVAPLNLDAVGVVEAIHTAALRSQVTGTIIKVDFQEGQDVGEGAQLFELDPRPFQNALNSAEANLEQIRAQLENARMQVERYTSLNMGSIVTKEQFQQIQVAERVLATQEVVAENAVANARLQLDYCLIRAPFAGRTGGLGAHVGDLVRASDATTSLVTINQLSPIYVTFGVPQQHLAVLARYRAAGTIAVAATPPGAEQSTENGQLTFVDNAVDPATGTLKLKATFTNPAHRLWPGQYVAVRITLAAPEVLTVPSAAIQNGQNGPYVFVVKEDLTAELRPVVIERTVENDSVITSGLKEGETVVIDGQFRVTAGHPVEIKHPAGTDAPAAPKRKKKTG
ncbi:MAG TPA: efflux RND transporter periplasmic adaptor subunit [Lacunisphaera sp.]